MGRHRYEEQLAEPAARLGQQGPHKAQDRASRKGVPLLPEMTQALADWRQSGAYSENQDWVFASPFTGGVQPYWFDIALARHVKSAARTAGVTKAVGWHTFRHSLATNLGSNAVDPKVVQEILRLLQ